MNLLHINILHHHTLYNLDVCDSLNYQINQMIFHHMKLSLVKLVHPLFIMINLIQITIYAFYYQNNNLLLQEPYYPSKINQHKQKMDVIKCILIINPILLHSLYHLNVKVHSKLLLYNHWILLLNIENSMKIINHV